MKKILILMNHKLTDEQEKELKDQGYEIHYLPRKLQEKFSNVDPSNVVCAAKEIADYVLNNDFDAVVLQGHNVLCAYLWYLLMKNNVRILYAHSKREVQEIPQEDGSVKKVSIFKHEGFHEYANFPVLLK